MFPAIPIKLIYGTADPVCLALVRKYVWAVIPLALSMILPQYLWARHKPWIVLWLVPAAIIYIGLLFVHHDSPEQMISCLFVGGWLSLIILGILVAIVLKRDSRVLDKVAGDGA